jgi:hypothetical protein
VALETQCTFTLVSSLPYSSTTWWAETLSFNVYEEKSMQDTITYLHACCFSPVTDTWLKSTQNGHFATWPSVTVENVRKYLGRSDATAKGHLNQIRQNIRSTQQVVEITAPEIDMVQEDKCHYMYATKLETNQIYSDLTGIFPTTSLSGNKYMLILYDYDRNMMASGRRMYSYMGSGVPK